MMRFRMSACSHIGKRTTQEDSFLAVPSQGLAAVFDGLGGHPHGEDASKAAAQALGNLKGEPSVLAMEAGIWLAHQAVVELDKGCPCGGPPHKFSCGRLPPATTLSALWIGQEDQAVIGHIGDTRIWHVRGKSIILRTTDHGRGSWLSKALGLGQGEPDIFTIDVQAGDIFCLLSDGVALEGEDLLAAIEGGPWEEVAERVVSVGMHRYAERNLGGNDNATALIIRPEEGEEIDDDSKDG